MDKKIAGLFGAATALAAMSGSGANAAVRLQNVMTVESYADLLQPVADPVPLLEASNAILSNAVLSSQEDVSPASPELVQYYHHHHHHHHRMFLRRLFRPRYHHHHHHHFYHHHHHHNY